MSLLPSYFVRIPRLIRWIYPEAKWVLESDGFPCTQWTIDDGPHPESTDLWLKFLDQLNIKATFFLNGRNCKEYPSLVNAIRAEKHIIGNHGYEHIDGWSTSYDRYIYNYKKGKECTESELYRPPYGRITLRQYCRIIKSSSLVMWTYMPGDFDSNVSSEKLKQRLSLTLDNDIVVMHDSPSAIGKLYNSR